MAALDGNTITADGTYSVTVLAGKRYSFAAAGTFGGGSLAVKWVDSAGNATAYPDSPCAEAESFVFTAATNRVDLVLTGATAPLVTISLALAVPVTANPGEPLLGTPLNATKAFNWIIYGTPSNGNTINVNGTTLTKVASAPAANQFTTITQLIALINADPDLYSYALDSTTVYLEARVAGTSGNAIVLSSASFRCYYANPPAVAPGFLVEGVDGTVATAETQMVDSTGRMWKAFSNTISESNWRIQPSVIDTLRPTSDPDYIGSRNTLVGRPGDLLIRSGQNLEGYSKFPAISDGEMPYGRSVIPLQGSGTYSDINGDFFGESEPLLFMPIPAEIGMLGTVIRLWGEIDIAFTSGMPGLFLHIAGNTESVTDGSTGLCSSIIPASTSKLKLFLDVDIELKDSTGIGAQGYESYLYLDIIRDRSLRVSGSSPALAWGSGISLQGSPGNFHEPCGSADKTFSLSIGREVGAGTAPGTHYVRAALNWDIIPPDHWVA